MQAVNGLDKGEGLAGAGFHQHIQPERGQGCGGHLNIARAHMVTLTDCGNVLAQRGGSFSRHHGRVAMHIGRRHKTHVGKHIGNGLHRQCLVG